MKIGDIVIVTDEYKTNDNNNKPIAGRIGRIISKLKEEFLINFGEGFYGHRGVNNECSTKTSWYIREEYLKIYKKGNYKKYV